MRHRIVTAWRRLAQEHVSPKGYNSACHGHILHAGNLANRLPRSRCPANDHGIYTHITLAEPEPR